MFAALSINRDEVGNQSPFLDIRERTPTTSPRGKMKSRPMRPGEGPPPNVTIPGNTMQPARVAGMGSVARRHYHAPCE